MTAALTQGNLAPHAKRALDVLGRAAYNRVAIVRNNTQTAVAQTGTGAGDTPITLDRKGVLGEANPPIRSASPAICSPRLAGCRTRNSFGTDGRGDHAGR